MRVGVRRSIDWVDPLYEFARSEHEFGLEVPFEGAGRGMFEFVEIPLEGRGAALD